MDIFNKKRIKRKKVIEKETKNMYGDLDINICVRS